MASFAQWLPELPCASLWKACAKHMTTMACCCALSACAWKCRFSNCSIPAPRNSTHKEQHRTFSKPREHASTTRAAHQLHTPHGHPAQRASREHGEAACFAHAACRKQRKTCGLAAIDCRKCCGARCLASVQAPRRPCARVQVHSGTRCSCNTGSPNTAFRDVFCDEVLVVTLRSEC